MCNYASIHTFSSIYTNLWPGSVFLSNLLEMLLGKSFKQVPVTYHHHQHYHDGRRVVTKGCVAIKVGQGEDQQRITVPVMYLNHPLFAQLLKEAEEEFGFAHQGTITIPCQVAQFKYVQRLIDSENKSIQNQHQNHLVGCFRSSSLNKRRSIDHIFDI